jgi:cytosine/adenosine deaminase-related metal-dependent hydrolase
MIRFHARWVVPVTAPPMRDATVVVDGSVIAYVGPRGGAPPGEDEELGDAILCPGLVNAHCHVELTAMRGFLEDLGFRDWILRLTTAKRVVLSRDDLLDSARLGLVEGIRAGITTYADTCDSGVAVDAMVEAGVRGIMYQEVFGPDPVQRDASMEELRGKIDVLVERSTPLVAIGVSPHAPYTVSDSLFAAVAEYAATRRLPVAVHIAESADESALVEQGAGHFAEGLRTRGIAVRPRGRSPVDVLHRTGMLDVRPLLIHLIRADAADLDLVRRARAPVAHCPVSNAKLGHGIAPLMDMLRAGIQVGLGSDSVASNNRMDLLEEAHTAVLMQSAASGRAGVLPAAEAFALATIGGAGALGLEHRIGSLETGKEADLAAFRLPPERGAPVYDPVAALVHAIRGGDAIMAAVAGRILMRNGVVPNAAADLLPRIVAMARRLAAWRDLVQAEGGPVPPPSRTR